MSIDFWSSREPITAGKLNGPVDEIVRLWEAIDEIRRGQMPQTTPVFWARLTSESSGAYQWIQVRRASDNLSWQTYTGGLSSDGTSSTSSTGVAARPSVTGKKPVVGASTGVVVLMRPEVDTSGGLQFLFEHPRGRFVMFPITLSQTGGSAGNSTTQCSFTYTVTDPETSAQLGTGVNPTSSPHTWNRPSLGTLVAADSGMAFYNASDQLVIVFVNETPDVEACS